MGRGLRWVRQTVMIINLHAGNTVTAFLYAGEANVQTSGNEALNLWTFLLHVTYTVGSNCQGGMICAVSVAVNRAALH